MDDQQPHIPADSSIVHGRSAMVGGRPPARLAAIDVGTNTIRLLIGEADDCGGYRVVLGTQEITRLGQGLLPDRILQPEPMRRSLETLARFRRLCADHGVGVIAAGGTSAVREARNRDDFVSRARREADLEIALISGEDEARLTLLGVRAALDPPPRFLLMLDIGGGSTELLLADGPRIVGLVSTGLGAVKLTETYLAADPPTPVQLAAAGRAADERFARARHSDLPAWADPPTFVGTAGTITTLAAIDLGLETYDPARVTGHRLTRDRISGLLADLAGMPLSRRRHVRGLEPARADIIVAGTLICLSALRALGFPALTVSDGGLREGILLDLLRRTGRPSPGC
jgi:exopolyphosphatase/guanosine-5'-triphosphate,3'-diphosphate pyrophosphatase